ncbi:ClpP/crotonase-like domain-containing protein [Rhexocercosporidium sp. MPI-PUGE-AT-0058]|nr:ClpP/crotonase-like domain-containing protein [Rhexocercosporidium sp. MPI-PUGE-AT-0058]
MPSPQPKTAICSLSFPASGVLLVTLTRAKELNTIPRGGHEGLGRVWQWMDSDPEILAGVFTGSGRAFCTGADLREWNIIPAEERGILPPQGFCGISQIHGQKPIIAAVNRLAVGGGVETLINCDMVICSPKAIFALPDVKVGLSLLGGTLPLLVQKIGRGHTTDMVLTGRNVGTAEALKWRLVDRIVEDPVREAVAIAKSIAANSPDAVWATREGIFLGMSGKDSFDAGREFQRKYWAPFLREGRNSKEGIAAFLEKRKPNWVLDWNKSNL